MSNLITPVRASSKWRQDVQSQEPRLQCHAVQKLEARRGGFATGAFRLTGFVALVKFGVIPSVDTMPSEANTIRDRRSVDGPLCDGQRA